MGFLAFFSRKSSSNKLSGHGVTAQAYEVTMASAPPLTGQYPVAGNGPNALDALSKFPPFNQTRASLNVSSQQFTYPPEVFTTTAASAPCPSVRRYRDAESIERPKTAPSSGQPTTSVFTALSKRRESSLISAPISFRKPRLLAPAASQLPELSQLGQQPQGPAQAHHRGTSIVSDGGRSVDILDAQSEISHSDFRARLQAVGAREYGEDVADRNIAENGFDFDSLRVQAFYSTTAAPSVSPRSVSAPVRSQVRHPSLLPSPLKTKSLDSSSARARSPTTTSYIPVKVSTAVETLATSSGQPSTPKVTEISPVPTKIPSHVPDHHSRQPVTTYVPSGSSSGFTSNTSAKMRPRSIHRPGVPKRDEETYISAGRLPERPATSWHPDPTDRAGGISHYVPKRLEESSVKKSRLPVTVPSGRTGEVVSGFQFPLPSACRPTHSGGPTSNCGSVFTLSPPSQSSPSSPVRKRPAARRHTLHSLNSSVSSTASRGPYRGLLGLGSNPGPGYPGLGVSAENADANASPAEPAPSHCSKPSHTRSDSRDSTGRHHSYSRSRSMGFPKKGGYLEDISEHIHVPERTSSLRHWSMTSTAPTTCSLSSSHFGRRPPSRQSRNAHTANTSIDIDFIAKALSSTSLLSFPPSSRGSIYSSAASAPKPPLLGDISIVDGQNLLSTAVAVKGVPPSLLPSLPSLPSLSSLSLSSSSSSLPAMTTANLNIDDYVTSDDDSFTTRQPRGEGEEDLLFRDDGYGSLGSQLPGLFESLEDGPASAPTIPRRRPTAATITTTARTVSMTSMGTNTITSDRARPRSRHSTPESEPGSPYTPSFPPPSVRRYRDLHQRHQQSPARGRSRSMRCVADVASLEILDILSDGNYGSSVDHLRRHHNQPYDSFALDTDYQYTSRSSSSSSTHDSSEDDEPAPAPPSAVATPTAAAAAPVSNSEISTTSRQINRKIDLAVAMKMRRRDKARKRAMELESSRNRRASIATIATIIATATAKGKGKEKEEAAGAVTKRRWEEHKVVEGADHDADVE